MKSMKWHRPFFVVAALALTLGADLSLRAQGRGEHWVGTWATAEVGRPQTPPPPAAPVAPAAGQTQGGPPPTPAPFMHFNNQTLRQIVHTSIGGNRMRIVLSNRF